VIYLDECNYYTVGFQTGVCRKAWWKMYKKNLYFINKKKW